jgi:hypothetical protein
VATQISARESEIENEGGESDAASRAQDWHLVGRISSWAFLGLAAIGITEAQLSFVPERRSIRRRPLPPPPVPADQGKPSAAPSVAVTRDGFALGISGKF